MGATPYVQKVNFGAEPKKTEDVVSEKKKGGAAPAVASAFLPGLGQFIDGRNKEGCKYLFGTMGLSVLSWLACLAGLAKGGKAGTAGVIAAAVGGLAGSVLYIKNIVDAYKGGKKA
jgi:hypothetical protein